MISFTRLFQQDERYRLIPGALAEASGDVSNPGRGWYHIYTYSLGEGINCDLPPFLYEGETVSLVLIDIGAYREQPLGGSGLAMIDRILTAFSQAGRDILLRIVYDTVGKGMEREPSFAAQVRQHIEQLAPLLLSHADHIMVFQGLLVGSWGEMHDSKFVTERHLPQLADTFLARTEGKIKLAVRKPVQYRMLTGEEEEREQVGFFDDAMFASGTHMGTFGIRDRAEAGWTEPWRAEDELPFMAERARFVPFGGEALSGEAFSVRETVEKLKAFQVSYLNCVHDERRLEEWRRARSCEALGHEACAYDSLYQYIGAHLGYRLVLVNVSLDRPGKKNTGNPALKLLFENRGFACACNDMEALLYVRGDSGEEILRSYPGRLGQLGGGERMEMRLTLEEGMLREGCRLYLSLRRKYDGRIIRLANQGAEGSEGLLLGTVAYKGS